MNVFVRSGSIPADYHQLTSRNILIRSEREQEEMRKTAEINWNSYKQSPFEKGGLIKSFSKRGSVATPLNL